MGREFRWKILAWKGIKKVLLVAAAGGLTALVSYFKTLESNTSTGIVFLVLVFICNSGLNWIRFHNI